MAKAKPSGRDKSHREKRGDSTSLNKVLPDRPVSRKSTAKNELAEELLTRASALLQTSQTDEALPIAERSLKLSQSNNGGLTLNLLPTLNLLAEINLELGNAHEAREYFLQASVLDPNGLVPELQGGGVEKFLWLAQLSEEGGKDSVSWFEKAILIQRNAIALTLEPTLRMQKSKKLAAALCGVIEIYMTDLSWESDAEIRCETLITEAILLAPESPETLQTLANVRISQSKLEEARKALAGSIEIWKNLPAGDEGVPDFPTRISLSRLLMEVEMEGESMEVLERLVEEDDTSVEAWYLGGWCSYLIAEKSQAVQNLIFNGAKAGGEDSERHEALTSSHDWLRNSLRLYELQDYEDDRLRDHALELLHHLDEELGESKGEDEDEEAQDEEWESDVEDEDQEMDGT
ncbi:MAG: hypothetical protein Q9182_002574 [Xanthomendoza sp. 2 TL-2023]